MQLYVCIDDRTLLPMPYYACIRYMYMYMYMYIRVDVHVIVCVRICICVTDQ